MHGRPIHVSRVIHSFNFCAHCADEEIDNKVVGELHRKSVANSIWNHHVEQELKEKQIDFTFDSSCSRERLMQKVDAMRASSTYPHDKCSDDCKKRGNLLYIAYVMCLSVSH